MRVSLVTGPLKCQNVHYPVPGLRRWRIQPLVLEGVTSQLADISDMGKRDMTPKTSKLLKMACLGVGGKSYKANFILN